MQRKFSIKNKNRDDWAKFLFREIEKDERRPEGSGWLDLDQLIKISGIDEDNIRTILNKMRHAKDCELYTGKVRNEGGFIVKHVWYKLAKGNWKAYFRNRQFQKDRQRLPDGKDWYTIKDIERKTGFARSKILRLIKEHKVNRKIRVFDGYVFNPNKKQLVRKIWYKLCLNG